MKKATSFFEIQNATSYDIATKPDSEFYTDFTKFRNVFTQQRIFKNLGISGSNQCNITTAQKIFLSGYRGTGKTSELLSINQKINDSKCYYSVFVDVSDSKEVNINDIDTIDILMLMLQTLSKQLEKDTDISISGVSIDYFYQWYNTKIITEVNKNLNGSAKIEIGVTGKIGIPCLTNIFGETLGKIYASKETKEIVRREINNNFQLFSNNFNIFIASLIEDLSKHGYQDILFIVDGFEKHLYKDTKRILIDNATMLSDIRAHMIITLPIELFYQYHNAAHFANTETLPLIKIKDDRARAVFKEFILKRVDKSLFDNDSVIDKIIEYGAGHPRQTLHIITQAYLAAKNEILDLASVDDAIKELGIQISRMNQDELEVLKIINDNKQVSDSDAYINLKARNIIFEYYDGYTATINPIVLDNKRFQDLLTA